MARVKETAHKPQTNKSKSNLTAENQPREASKDDQSATDEDTSATMSNKRSAEPDAQPTIPKRQRSDPEPLFKIGDMAMLLLYTDNTMHPVAMLVRIKDRIYETAATANKGWGYVCDLTCSGKRNAGMYIGATETSLVKLGYKVEDKVEFETEDGGMVKGVVKAISYGGNGVEYELAGVKIREDALRKSA